MARERPVILDDDEPPSRKSAEPRDPPAARAGFEWGLASTLMGATLLIAGTGGMVVCLLLWFAGHGQQHGLSYSDLTYGRAAGVVMAGGAFLTSAVSFLFGMRALRRARRADQPAALPVAGLLLSLAATLLWLIVLVDFVMIIESFLSHSPYY